MRKIVLLTLFLLIFLSPLSIAFDQRECPYFRIPAVSAQEEKEEDDALKDARRYIAVKPFSRQGLIEYMEAEGYSGEEAAAAADALEVDWNEMALKQAQSFLGYMSLSEEKLIEQLQSVGFTKDQSAYGVENAGADWNELATKHAESYLQLMKFSKTDLIRQLEFDGFSYDQAVAGVTALLGPLDPSEAEALSDPNRVSQEMIEFLSSNLENVFPLQSLKESFISPVIPMYYDFGPDTAIQTRTREGDQSIRLFVNSDSVHDYNYLFTVNSGNLQNFMFTMDVRIRDVFPADQGGCFIGYKNDSVTAYANEDAALVALLVNPKGVEFYRKENRADSGTHTLISENGQYSYKLTLMRLTGLTFAFVDGKFAGQFYDSEEGPFQLVYGSAVYKDGDTASCSFDNLAVRKVNN